jgi:hypothetical protein
MEKIRLDCNDKVNHVIIFCTWPKYSFLNYQFLPPYIIRAPLTSRSQPRAKQLKLAILEVCAQETRMMRKTS